MPFLQEPKPCDKILIQIVVLDGELKIRQFLKVDNHGQTANAPADVQLLKIKTVRPRNQPAGLLAVAGDMPVIVVDKAVIIGLHPGHTVLQFLRKPQVVRIQKRGISSARILETQIAGLGRAAPSLRSKKAEARV